MATSFRVFPRALILGSFLILAGRVLQAATAAAPTITTPPANKTVNVGQTASFTVVATGGTLTYQWKKNGANVTGGTGATTATYTTVATVAGDSGSQFTVVVTDGTGSVTSTPAAVLTVNVQPAITTQPIPKSIVVGQTATFTVVATGNSLTYQWMKGAGTAPGASTGASYTTPPVVIGDNNAVYTVVVTNTVGNVTSTPVTLTVGAATAPAITLQPGNQSVVVGQTATFTVTASGSTPLTYLWKKGAGTAPGTSNAATYTTPPVVIGDNSAVYSCVVTNAAGTATSNNAVLTVGPATAPGFTAQPTPQTVFVGQTATFTVTASGSTPLTYLWKKGAGTAPGTSTAATYTTPVTVIGDNGAMYSCVVTNAGGTLTSSVVALTVNPLPLPTITTPPASQSVVVGQTATFTVLAAGMGTLSYQWKKGGVDIGGATGTSYTTPVTTIGNNGDAYSVVVTNTPAGGSTPSATATLTVTPLTPPTITVQPANTTVIVGFPATFRVTATSTAAITYAWSKNGVPIGGATAAVYTTPVTALTDEGAIYTVVCSNTAGGTPSNPAMLHVEISATDIPDPWLDLDIGTVGMPGDATLISGAFTVCGAGADIAGTADAFNYLYQPLTGDGSVTAHVNPGTATAQAKAGVMIRETLTSGSAMAGMFVTGAAGTVFVQRGTTGGTATQTAGTPVTVPLPYWVKLDRTGNTFTGSISPDGTNWTVIGTSTIVLPVGVFIGFAVTSADIAQLNCSVVDAWSGTGGWRPALRKSSGGGGGGGGGCGLLGLEGILLTCLAHRLRRGSAGGRRTSGS